jgi:hypothetical protein
MKATMYRFDNLEILLTEQHNTRVAYNDIMSSIRDIDVDDIIRESPAFDEDTDTDH